MNAMGLDGNRNANLAPSANTHRNNPRYLRLGDRRSLNG